MLIDDIISTGRTMIAALRHLKNAGMPPPLCIGVHAVFAGGTEAALREAGARVVTADTIIHATNQIALAPLLAEAVLAMTGRRSNAS